MAVFKKINSRKGASITFALLAFLVCAVVSSVVLAAATASAGRASDLAVMDQRYYAVSSAAQLFRDTLDGQEITIERSDIQTTYTYHPYQKKADGTVEPISVNVPSAFYAPFYDENGDLPKRESEQKLNIWMKLPGEEDQYLFASNDSADEDDNYSISSNIVDNAGIIQAAAAKSFLVEAAIDCVFGGPKPVDEAYVPTVFGADVEPNTKKSMSIDVEKHPELTVDVEYYIKKDGTITFTFSKGDAGDMFKMQMVLIATVRDNSSSPTVKTVETQTVAAVDAENGKFTEQVTSVKESTKTTVITWSVAEVRKVI